MTKTLTEQWREGKIKEGFYYVHFCTGEIVYRHLSGNKPDKEFIELGCFQEILAPVPSYNEYQQLVSKAEQLEKRLEIATKALKSFIPDDLTDGGFGEMYEDVIWDCKKALKEMEGVK